MKTTPGRTTSIARRIGWSLHWKKLWRILFQSLVLFAVAVAAWCFATAQAAGVSLTAGAEWYIQPADRAFADLHAFAHSVIRQLQGEDVLTGIVVFQVGKTTADMSVFLFWLSFCLVCLTGARLLLWTLGCFRATARIRRYLKPIDDIAQVTESISSHGFDESKFHSLEEAIDHLNGASPDEQLHIGDDDLSGLETAVNNLIARMHAGYRQQVRFVDDASHELRTPIAVIQGYADMLDRWGKTDEKVLNESIRAIQTETEHMKTLVEQLLFLARGDAGRQELKMTDMDLAATVREVFEESRMIDGDHRYVLDAAGPVIVRGDAAMLKQAVRILADNARKYSPADTRITLRAYREGDRACAQVQDNGAGVAEKDAPHIFDRFYRADAARSGDAGGSGLGLAIARWIVTRHGGSFTLRSYEGVGSRFTILLPARDGPAAGSPPPG